MFAGRLVPWVSWHEWQDARTRLFSSDHADVNEGLARVEAWRVRGRVPLAVDCTALLRETQILDHDGAISDAAVRSQYCLALVRLVNGISDSSQRGKTAASVAALASAAGVPRFLIDMRHEATHNELPSLAAARVGAHAALSWLRACYWQRQEEHLAAADKKLAALLASFIDAVGPEEAAAGEGSRVPEGGGKRPGGAEAAKALTALQSFVGRTSVMDLADGVWRAVLSDVQRSTGAGECLPGPALTAALQRLRGVWPGLGGLVLNAAVVDDLAGLALALPSVDGWNAVLGRLLRACPPSPAQARQVLERRAVVACARAWTRDAPAKRHLLALCERLRATLTDARDEAWIQTALASCLGPTRRERKRARQGPADIDALLARAERLASEAAPDAATLAPAGPRWSRVAAADWRPCALGNLPSGLDANGIQPSLCLENDD